jgi:hypothetical protein
MRTTSKLAGARPTALAILITFILPFVGWAQS